MSSPRVEAEARTGQAVGASAAAASLPASGAQYRLRAAGYEAWVSGVGATVRSLTFEGRPLVHAFPADRMRPEMSGALLAPWPNRIAGGTYAFEGQTHHLPIDEPATTSALHGLAAWQQFVPVSVGADGVHLTATIQPRPGYPWRVRLDVEFLLDDHGLSQRLVATNESERVAPFGAGAHPYLVASGADAHEAGSAAVIDEWMLELPADDLLQSASPGAAARVVPVDVAGLPDLDFRLPRRIGATVMNHAFTCLHRDADGFARARLVGAGGRGAQIAWGPGYRWVQVYTADAADPPLWRRAVAIEPQTCPPDAFNSGRDIILLEPRESTTLRWCISNIG